MRIKELEQEKAKLVGELNDPSTKKGKRSKYCSVEFIPDVHTHLYSHFLLRASW